MNRHNRCKNCVTWTKTVELYSDRGGECTNPKLVDGWDGIPMNIPRKGLLATPAHGDGVTIYTDRDFGCIHFRGGKTE